MILTLVALSPPGTSTSLSRTPSRNYPRPPNREIYEIGGGYKLNRAEVHTGADPSLRKSRNGAFARAEILCACAPDVPPRGPWSASAANSQRFVKLWRA